MTQDYYKILGIAKSASQDEIRIAYRKLAKQYHPDINPENPEREERFKLISQAYETLSNPEKKLNYDNQQEYFSFHSGKNSYQTRYRKPDSYSPRVKLYGRLAVIGILLVVTVVSLSMFYYTSVVRYNEGVEFEKKGNNTLALHSYDRAVRFGGGRNYEALLNSGLIYERNGWPGQANKYYNRALEYASDQQVGYLQFRISSVFYTSEEYDSAITHLTLAETKDYSTDSILLLSARINAFGYKNYEQAKTDYAKLVERGILLDVAWFGIGFCEHSENRLESAITAYSKAIDANPDYGMAYFYRGNAHYFNDNIVQACADFDQARMLNFRMAEATYLNYCQDRN